MDVKAERFDERLEQRKAPSACRAGHELTVEDLKALVDEFKRSSARTPAATSRPTVRASSTSPSRPSSRAGSASGRATTAINKIARRPGHGGQRRDDGVRQHGRRLGTGVAFTRDPNTGEKSCSAST
jgi:hypothetical protein